VTKRYAFETPKAVAPEKIPRVARLLAVAHKFQKMLDSGEVESMAELARLGRVSRARITQVMDLLLLAPDIQESVLLSCVDEEGPSWWTKLGREPLWNQQRAQR
jgi:hypothetical protein